MQDAPGVLPCTRGGGWGVDESRWSLASSTDSLFLSSSPTIKIGTILGVSLYPGERFGGIRAVPASAGRTRKGRGTDHHRRGAAGADGRIDACSDGGDDWCHWERGAVPRASEGHDAAERNWMFAIGNHVLPAWVIRVSAGKTCARDGRSGRWLTRGQSRSWRGGGRGATFREPTSGLEPLTPAPVTSDNSGVAGTCTWLQIPHT
jgi:hypothetical protein